ncbi:hypothetical protein LX36DRAFT_286877 [Colletotrichum falcatum]|nr:hypothetical protein LX36DRAFT_286877 [Colletotrichum falcatum]
MALVSSAPCTAAKVELDATLSCARLCLSACLARVLDPQMAHPSASGMPVGTLVSFGPRQPTAANSSTQSAGMLCHGKPTTTWACLKYRRTTSSAPSLAAVLPRGAGATMHGTISVL